jgi:arylsulfatase A-like enzyme
MILGNMKQSGISRRQWLGGLAAASLHASAFAQRPASGRRPNIVVILADDQGWGDLSISGNTNLSTPNIDSIGKDGAVFDRFFVCAVCAPTRAEFLTGRYHPRGGVRGVSTGAERLDIGERTIAEVFRDAGYATAAFGKWHNGTQFPYHPNARGFQEYYGMPSGHWPNYFDTEIDHNGTLVKGKGYVSDDLTDHAIRFMTDNRSKPFFCYLPFNTPHSPMQVPDKYWDRFAAKPIGMTARDPKQEDIPFTRAALAMVENIDWNVGRVLSALDKLKLANDTIVLYFSDNGPNGWRWNGGMKGRRGSVDEGGLRSPLMMRWPGHIAKGRKVTRIAGAIDLLPTLTELSGVPVTGTKPLDGVSLKPLLTAAADESKWPDRMIFSLQGKRMSVRTQQYRLDPEGKLFDMVADPMQDKDIAAEKPDVAKRLQAALDAWGKEVLPLVGKDDRPFTVGYARESRLPARDGIQHGGIKRSNTAPNSSYFTNWTDKDGFMTWDIEVGTPGKYVAELWYTCPAGSEGSTVELTFAGSSLTGKIDKAWDPPLRGATDDRVPRGTESYWKDFKPLRLGIIDLPKQRGLLTLRATDIPGKTVADLRRIILKQV